MQFAAGRSADLYNSYMMYQNNFRTGSSYWKVCSVFILYHKFCQWKPVFSAALETLRTARIKKGGKVLYITLFA